MSLSKKELLYSNGNQYITYTEDENGNKQGEYIKYFNNNLVDELSTYKDNMLDGEYKKYVLNNNNNKHILVLSCSYKDNKLNGPYLTWNGESGLCIKSCNYIMGNLDGIYETWDDYSGKPIEIANYKDNKLDGEYIKLHYNGNIYNKNYYKNGKLLPGSKTFEENGKLASEFIGKTNTHYYSNGKISKKDIYNDDYNLIISTQYNKSGATSSEMKINNGKKIITHYQYVFYGHELQIIRTIEDYDKKTITVLTPVDSYIKREIYNFKQCLIKKDIIDTDGNIIPSFYDSLKSALCNLFSKTKKVVEKATEEVELLNDKID
jgi:antitoxin component YwqK of YwqJK toxin-antitoxin module